MKTCKFIFSFLVLNFNNLSPALQSTTHKLLALALQLVLQLEQH